MVGHVQQRRQQLRPGKVRARAALVAAMLTVGALLPAGAARAEGVYWTTPDLLRTFFPSSERVTFVEVSRAAVEAALGNRVKKDKYVVFVAKTGEHVDGYAVIDDEKGEHQPIGFGVKLDAEGRVQRTEVMSYREAYGEEIREQRFQKQFVGRGLNDARRFGDDVVAISGASISSRSMTLAVRRALALVVAARALPTAGRQAALPQPTTGG